MAIPKVPGMSFIGMVTLLEQWRVPLLKPVFSTELLLAIAWEETLFNNVKQDGGGTAVGFGQMEPSEFWKLRTSAAKDRGYFINNLPRANGKILTRQLTQFESVRVQSAMLCQLYIDLKNNAQAALEAYAGVPFSRELAAKVAKGLVSKADADKIDPPHLKVAGRLAKIAGWRQCERILQHELPDTDPREKIKEALNASREFGGLESLFDPILFPEGDEFWQEDFKLCFGNWTITV
jgi:hypothetical protein